MAVGEGLLLNQGNIILHFFVAAYSQVDLYQWVMIMATISWYYRQIDNGWKWCFVCVRTQTFDLGQENPVF